MRLVKASMTSVIRRLLEKGKVMLKTPSDIMKMQTLLLAKGFDPLGIDGDIGRNTIKAIKAFQKVNNLKVDGIPGVKTLTALGFIEESIANKTAEIQAIEPIWVLEAKKYLGMHEIKDAKVLDKLINLDTSETPWCGGFVGMVIAKSLPDEQLPANMLWARNWIKLGFGLEKTNVVLGGIAIFSRNGGGHVGIIVGHDADTLHILGGNQQNMVSVARIAKDRLLEIRYPSTGGPIGPVLTFSTLKTTISRNEA